MYDMGDGSLLDRLHHLLLPALVTSIGGWIGFSRILRFEMLRGLNQDYVRTAKAKGFSQQAVIWACAAQCTHAFYNRVIGNLPPHPLWLNSL